MSIALTGKDDLLVGKARDLLAAESGLDVLHFRLDDLLDGRRNVAEVESLFLLADNQGPDNVVGWVSQINPEKGGGRRLVLCMPRPNARISRLLLKHVDEIISPSGFTAEHFVERVLGSLILEKRIEPYSYGALYGATRKMRDVYRDIEKYARLKEPVLVWGKTGTGKELVARAIHKASTRSSQVFAVCDCTILPKELVESRLFGHKRGAFTGAVSDYLGIIRAAAGGTLFLDEVGELPLDVQPKLLRLLQEGEIQTLGEKSPQKVDVRFVFATSRDLRKDVEERKFRRDLFARINRVVLELPPLRDRKADIPLLVEHFKARFNRDNGTEVEINPAAIDELFCIDWEENVRDLDNVVARAAANVGTDRAVTDILMSESLRRAGGYGGALGQAAANGPYRSVAFRPSEEEWRVVRDRAEYAYFRAIVEVAKGEKEALELSGMKKARFYEILKKHGLSLNQ